MTTQRHLYITWCVLKFECTQEKIILNYYKSNKTRKSAVGLRGSAGIPPPRICTFWSLRTCSKSDHFRKTYSQKWFKHFRFLDFDLWPSSVENVAMRYRDRLRTFWSLSEVNLIILRDWRRTKLWSFNFPLDYKRYRGYISSLLASTKDGRVPASFNYAAKGSAAGSRATLASTSCYNTCL